MKKLLLALAFIFNVILPVKADVMPYYINSINTNSIGVYQAANRVRVYKEPNEHSTLLLDISWTAEGYNCVDVSASNLFVVFLPVKNLAFLTVVDENDNEDWVKISYNKNGLKTGWLKKDDEFRFMNWRTFFNLYGRKYGLYYMKDAPEESKIIYGSSSDEGKQIGKVTMARNVSVTAINGNWVLAVAVDIDRTQKIGWLKWRNISGEMYLFPAIK